MAEDADGGDHDAATDTGGDGEVEGIAGRRPTPPAQNRVRNAMVWGLVATLSFGVLHQGYLLFLDGEFLGFAPVIAVALGVGVVVAMSSYLLMDRLAAANEQD
jgi:CHASE2 domain-containing sensor protein